ncbi:hypothetical protein LIER_11137 [Lithospermum erythrorhizon]|uniref:Folate receptor-like domain-containing protein n=1 Tax=Lithospermum erythrorhizon TaxID=34254 RepID=A0AAV3PNC7_LITER
MRSSNICCYCTLLFAASLNLFASFSFGKNNGVCVSPGGRFPPFSNEGKPPRRVNKGPKDLTFCRVFRKNTCCDVKQTHPALLSVRRLASTGEASQECLQLWELLECAICDPHVGTRRGIPLICESFCERIYQACSGAYFSVDAKTQVLAPCGVGDFVCGRASEYISNGTELCVVAGFSVMPRDDPEDISCYGGQASLDYIADSLKAPKAGVSREKQTPEILEELRDWWESMPLSNRISWAVGGMVLTAGLLLVSFLVHVYNNNMPRCLQRGPCLNGVMEVGLYAALSL